MQTRNLSDNVVSFHDTPCLLCSFRRCGSEFWQNCARSLGSLGGACGLGTVHHHGPQGTQWPGNRLTLLACSTVGGTHQKWPLASSPCASTYSAHIFACTTLSHSAVLCFGEQAQHLYLRDVHYLVKGNKAVIIDESTGRTSLHSRWVEGIHQAR